MTKEELLTKKKEIESKFQERVDMYNGREQQKKQITKQQERIMNGIIEREGQLKLLDELIKNNEKEIVKE